MFLENIDIRILLFQSISCKDNSFINIVDFIFCFLNTVERFLSSIQVILHHSFGCTEV